MWIIRDLVTNEIVIDKPVDKLCDTKNIIIQLEKDNPNRRFIPDSWEEEELNEEIKNCKIY